MLPTRDSFHIKKNTQRLKVRGLKRYCFDGPRRYCAESSKSDRERQISLDFLYMWNLKNKINNNNNKNRNKLIDTGNILRAIR